MMKKLLVVLMVLAIAGGVQANMLVNPGFEDGFLVDSWTVWTWGGGTADISSDAYEGLVSFDVVAVPNWGGGAGAYQGFPMGEGVTVSISAYAKDLSIDGPAGAAGIDMVFFSEVPTPEIPDPPNIGRVDLNLDGTFSGGPGVLIFDPPDENGWMYCYLETVTPAGTQYMKYEVNNNNNDGQVLFDNVVGIPEPVTIALLGLGGLLLRRRK